MTRVLVADDDERSRHILRVLLRAQGWEVDEVGDGVEALEAARERPPDLVVSDLLMPAMDGYALLRRWRAARELKSIPFLVYTGTYTEPRDERLALDLGADAFLVKPAEPDVLLARIREVLARSGDRRSGSAVESSALDLAHAEVLSRKLAQKVVDLERAHRQLGTAIADRTRAEETLRESEEHLRQAQKIEAVGRLAAGMAHDFGQILAAILGNAELACREIPADHPSSQSLEEIRRAALRGKSIVKRILAFSRQEPSERQVVELGPVVREAVALLRAIIAPGVDVVVSVDRKTPAVFADADQLHQLVVNLCTNAWQALEAGSGRIEVRVESVTLDPAAAPGLAGVKRGPGARLSISDDGRGMDAETLQRIFDPFFTTKEPGQGTGLGLSVVHGIVDAHDGVIAVRSRPRGGAVFEVFLPAAPESDAGRAQVGEGFRGAGEHILYLDDEEALVSLATRGLEQAGFRVSGFTMAREALAAFRAASRSFDFVVCDLNLSGDSGLDVTQQLLELRPDIPVLLCSGYVTDELRERARSIGAQGVLYKASSISELVDAIAAQLSGRRPSS